MCQVAVSTKENDNRLKYASLLENANYMQISNMIHVLICCMEW